MLMDLLDGIPLVLAVRDAGFYSCQPRTTGYGNYLPVSSSQCSGAVRIM
jgi:hypothetical protein